MQPKTSHDNSAAHSDDRKVVVPSRDDAAHAAPDREAAARLVRHQLDDFYASSGTEHGPVPAANTSSPGFQSLPTAYAKTHGDDGLALSIGGQSDAWEKYHSAWQNYYQQYYQRYYLQQLHSTRQKLAKDQPTGSQSHAKPRWLDDDAPGPIHSDNNASGELSSNTAADELKKRLLSTVKKHGNTIRRSHHFMPMMSAVTVGLIFMLLQYNQLLQGQVRAYISPGSINPQDIVVDPKATAAVGPEPKVIIPKLNVEAPIVYDVTSLENDPVEAGLKRGVVHYPLPGANSMPGQIGNDVILGHSSNDIFDDGQYKFVFSLLERMEVGDLFYINHEGKRYTYSVTKKEVINPSQVGALIYKTDKPLATLVTCVPVGTAANRLLVTGEQISPDPTKAIAAPGSGSQASRQTANIPGN